MLDIIMPHYDEPWEEGEKFFTMLDLQRDVDFSQIKVILVNDGPEHRLPDELFSHRPYQVEQICIEHGGVSAARNAGIEHSTAEWLCFCDFDDMFAETYALRSVLNVLPAPKYDILWADFYAENKVRDGKLKIYTRGENMGIRVDEEAMARQLEIAGATERAELDFHKKILNCELPYSIGGGIGQSRLCMYFLRKAHIGEVQAAIWPEDMIRECEENDIFLL